MKKIFMFGLILCCSLNLTTECFSGSVRDSCVVRMKATSMDWTRNTVVTSGSAFFKAWGEEVSHKAGVAERQAKIRAIKNLYDFLGEIYLDSSTTISHAQKKNPGMARDLFAMAQQAVVVETVRTSGHGYLVEVFVKLDLWDEQVRLFMPDFLFARTLKRNLKGNEVLLRGDCVINIDATGLEVSPAIIPSITDEHLDILYRASILGSGQRSGKSNIGYTSSSGSEPVFRTIRSHDQTMWIRADKASGELGTDILLDADGAERFTRVISSSKDDCSINIILK